MKLLPIAAPYHADILTKGKFYVAIEKHDQPCDLANPEPQAFVWCSAGPNVSISKIYDIYRGLSAEHTDAILTMGDITIRERGKLKDLPPPTNGILLVKAVKPESIPSPQLTSNASYSPKPRNPLRLINWQATAPTASPRRSAKETTPTPGRDLSPLQAPRSAVPVKATLPPATPSAYLSPNDEAAAPVCASPSPNGSVNAVVAPLQPQLEPRADTTGLRPPQFSAPHQIAQHQAPAKLAVNPNPEVNAA